MDALSFWSFVLVGCGLSLIFYGCFCLVSDRHDQNRKQKAIEKETIRKLYAMVHRHEADLRTVANKLADNDQLHAYHDQRFCQLGVWKTEIQNWIDERK